MRSTDWLWFDFFLDDFFWGPRFTIANFRRPVMARAWTRLEHWNPLSSVSQLRKVVVVGANLEAPRGIAMGDNEEEA